MKIKQTSRLGKRCPEYMAGCIICDGYRFFDENGRYPFSFEELFYYSKQKRREA
jgi:hypothetical protein